jgi:hypothetical protein
MRTATGILESTHGNCCMAVARWLLRGTHGYAYAQAQRVVYSRITIQRCVCGWYTHTHNLVVIENHCNLSSVSTSGARSLAPHVEFEPNCSQIAVKLLGTESRGTWGRCRAVMFHGSTTGPKVPVGGAL